VQVEGRTYATQGLSAVRSPAPETLVVHTLTAVRDYVDSEMDVQVSGPIMVHIVNEGLVHLISALDKPWEQRYTYLSADLLETAFSFGKPMDIESFIIGLQAKFQETEDRDTLLKLLSSIRAGQSIGVDDDGISQRMTVTRGVSLAKEVTAPKLVKLRPWRTFPEIEEQPESGFVFRLKDNGIDLLPFAALYEADGGKWRNAAIQAIREWFDAELPDVVIIG
jgi:hypothetical protein